MDLNLSITGLGLSVLQFTYRSLRDHVPAYSPFRCMIQALKLGTVVTMGRGTHQYHS